LSFAIQSSLIFIPLISAELGASDLQVGLIGAAYGGAYLLASLYSGQQSDRRGRLGFVRFGLFLCSIAFAAQLFAKHLSILATVRTGVGLSLGVTTAALVAYAFELGSDMGRFSSYGSLGWIGGAIASVFLTDFYDLFAVSAFACMLAFALSLFLSSQNEPKAYLKEETSPRMSAVIKQGFSIYLAVFLRHLGATSVWIILPLYFTSLGLDRSWIGILWGTNFTVQFIVMRSLERFSPQRVFAFGQVVSIIVFISYILIHNCWLLLLVQVMLGIAWACLYVGALLLVLRAGENRGTAAGVFQATINLCNAVGPFLGGIVAQNWSYSGVMLVAAILSTCGLVVAVPKTKAPSETENAPQSASDCDKQY